MGMLSDKTCLVTGAGRGIGQAIAARFLEEGAIVYAADRAAGAVEAWGDTLSPDMRQRLFPAALDITDREELRRLFMQIKKQQGRIDAAVNNAGIAYNERIGLISAERMRQMFEVNVFAALEVLQLCARMMLRQKSGSIINIASIVGVEGDKGQTAYSASKGAVIAMTKSAAKELAPSQIRVNAVAPGLTDTEMFRETDPGYLQERLGNIGMGRLASPADIADACLFLASDLSSYSAGQVLGVNGCSVL